MNEENQSTPTHNQDTKPEPENKPLGTAPITPEPDQDNQEPGAPLVADTEADKTTNLPETEKKKEGEEPPVPIKKDAPPEKKKKNWVGGHTMAGIDPNNPPPDDLK